jgi:peptidoglycan/LPS O-acetylase OafA/YrhL
MLRTQWFHRSSAPQQAYRADIDGLRAVAALAVVGTHAGWLKGGAYGVDVFFVISGYLISGIIFRALERERFSFIDFYARRVKRIFPALVALLMAVWTLGWLLLPPTQYARLGRDIAAGAGFAENIWFYHTIAERTHTPDYLITHLWTLGIEEQFYLLWPIFLYLTWRTGKMRFILMLTITAASFASYVGWLLYDSIGAALLPWNRLWQLSIGGALAYTQQITVVEAKQSPSKILVQRSGLALSGIHSMGTVGAAFIVIAFFDLLRPATPGLHTVLASVGSFLLIAAGPKSWVNRYALSTRPLVAVGLISYPLYLWHVSLFVSLPIFLGETRISEYQNVPLSMKVAALLGSMLLSYGTYKYLELPIRSSAHSNQVAGVLCAVMALCGAVALVVTR